MSPESQRVRARRRMEQRARIEAKRQEYLDLLSEGDPTIRAAIEHLSLGVLICMRHTTRQRELFGSVTEQEARHGDHQ